MPSYSLSCYIVQARKCFFASYTLPLPIILSLTYFFATFQHNLLSFISYHYLLSYFLSLPLTLYHFPYLIELPVDLSYFLSCYFSLPFLVPSISLISSHHLSSHLTYSHTRPLPKACTMYLYFYNQNMKRLLQIFFYHTLCRRGVSTWRRACRHGYLAYRKRKSPWRVQRTTWRRKKIRLRCVHRCLCSKGKREIKIGHIIISPLTSFWLQGRK